VNIQDLAGNTALHYACAADKAEAISELLKHSAIDTTILNKEKRQAKELCRKA
jgi:ankyrin repeat protein